MDAAAFQLGGLRSRTISISAAQIGIAATSKAARPEAARISAQETRPLPPTHSSRPLTASSPISRRASRTRSPRNRAHPSRNAEATTTRMKAIANGGKPEPSRTATRMPR